MYTLEVSKDTQRYSFWPVRHLRTKWFSGCVDMPHSVTRTCMPQHDPNRLCPASPLIQLEDAIALLDSLLVEIGATGGEGEPEQQHHRSNATAAHGDPQGDTALALPPAAASAGVAGDRQFVNAAPAACSAVRAGSGYLLHQPYGGAALSSSPSAAPAHVGLSALSSPAHCSQPQAHNPHQPHQLKVLSQLQQGDGHSTAAALQQGVSQQPHTPPHLAAPTRREPLSHALTEPAPGAAPDHHHHHNEQHHNLNHSNSSAAALTSGTGTGGGGAGVPAGGGAAVPSSAAPATAAPFAPTSITASTIANRGPVPSTDARAGGGAQSSTTAKAAARRSAGAGSPPPPPAASAAVARRSSGAAAYGVSAEADEKLARAMERAAQMPDPAKGSRLVSGRRWGWGPSWGQEDSVYASMSFRGSGHADAKQISFIGACYLCPCGVHVKARTACVCVFGEGGQGWARAMGPGRARWPLRLRGGSQLMTWRRRPRAGCSGPCRLPLTVSVPLALNLLLPAAPSLQLDVADGGGGGSGRRVSALLMNGGGGGRGLTDGGGGGGGGAAAFNTALLNDLVDESLANRPGEGAGESGDSSVGAAGGYIHGQLRSWWWGGGWGGGWVCGCVWLVRGFGASHATARKSAALWAHLVFRLAVACSLRA